MAHSYHTEGIVLKRSNVGEADRVVTLFTKEKGKLTVMARGVRRLTSSRAATLEPATQAVFYLAKGRNMDVLTQSKLVNSFSHARQNLTRMIQTYQILEIVDLLTVPESENPEVYDILLNTLEALETDGTQKDLMLENIRLILKALGFTHDKPFTETGLKDYIEELSQKRLRSKKYLSPENKK